MGQSQDGMGRRAFGRMLLAMPAAALPLSREEEKPAPSSEQADFIAAREAGLSPEERERLRKKISEGEKSLAAVRDFKVPMEVTPSLRFRAMKSRRH